MAKAAILARPNLSGEKSTTASMADSPPKVWNSRKLEYVTPMIFRQEEIVRLHAEGMTITEISQRFRCHYWTIYALLKPEKIKKRKRERE